jgi:SsrA-binding protein
MAFAATSAYFLPMAETKKKSLISHGIAAQNRKARFDYAIKDTVEAGLVLKGPEVKSLRQGRATLSEAWAGERDGEVWLFNAYIPEYQGGVLSRFEPRAPRKLLLKKKQIDTLLGAVARQGVTLVPLDIHFNERGRAKVLLGVGEGRKKQDKRAVIADRDWKRDKARLMRARG